LADSWILLRRCLYNKEQIQKDNGQRIGRSSANISCVNTTWTEWEGKEEEAESGQIVTLSLRHFELKREREREEECNLSLRLEFVKYAQISCAEKKWDRGSKVWPSRGSRWVLMNKWQHKLRHSSADCRKHSQMPRSSLSLKARLVSRHKTR
jgi:hypothetical protein